MPNKRSDLSKSLLFVFAILVLVSNIQGLLQQDRQQKLPTLTVDSDNLFHEWKNTSSSFSSQKAHSHIETLLSSVPKDTKLITVIDGHPMTLSWIGSVYGHKTITLGVDHFGQTGNVKELLTEFAIDSGNISNLGFKFA